MSGRAHRTPLDLKAALCLLAAVLMLAVPAIGVSVASAASIEGGNSFSELSQKAQAEEHTTSTATTTTTTGETGTPSETRNSQKTIFIAVGIALALLVGIAYVIIRDARRVAPAGDVAEIEARAVRDNAVQMRARRAKAKAASKQRKKNLKKR